MSELLRTLSDFLLFARRALAAQFTQIPPLPEFARHFYQAGVGSVGLLTILTVFAGLNLSVQSYATFERFGGQDFLGMFAGIGGVRELYPVMAAVVCGARIGANLAAALANMKISEQVEALEVMSVDPMRHLVAPRLWAVTLALPVLCGYANVIGIGASYAGAVWQLGLDGGTFRSQLAEVVGLSDLAVGMFKGLVFGWLVALIATFHGYRAAKKEGAEGVGIATNRAIVHGAVMCILLNLGISWLLYG
ncbi:MlaE family ABC transporter permease [Paraliomyxa miuraensis]|uniref:MlaE family ABC transporter permease n=1 Tax=Paraliomyxa miuraensis TaxID=376150 RepID=UPI00225AE7F0|nr:ABC transporter permease [Paraliomyxa miuraensis]MCX4247679.1 ABC transporter permease [Paraliomyxa miuraensis]